ncbi:MAG: UTP--glucose-1-phosphate uridylyltransferase [Kiritimatiellia bacterium]
MTYEEARALLAKHNQSHLLRFWDQLDKEARAALLKQVAALDFASIGRMQAMLRSKSAASAAGKIRPAQVVELDAAARARAVARGEEELRSGRVGAVLVAGGQGSRLGFEGPKGAFPIGPVTHAILFHFHVRKVLALGRRHGVTVPLYIMVSDANQAATRACFEAHDWFGMKAADVHFFEQGMWPALDAHGKIILDAAGHIFQSPDGHGGTLSALAASGALADMEQRRLQTIFYFQVDNPMVEVCDPAFLGVHLLEKADISLKVCAKRDAQEGLGVVVEQDGRCAMVEYSELTNEQKHQRGANGELYFKYGSVAIHVFALPFLKQEARAALPLHVAHKKVPVCGDDGQSVTPAKPNGYKFEKFIFDVLPDAKKVINLAFDRREEFSPVKNATGDDSPDTTRRDLSAKWARWLKAVGVAVPEDEAGYPLAPVEIDPCFAIDPADLVVRLRKRPDVTQAILL